MNRWLLALVLLWPSLALGQTIAPFGVPPLSGDPISPGLNFATATTPLFLPAGGATSLLAPYGVSFWIKAPPGWSPGSAGIVNFFNDSTNSGTQGFQILYRNTFGGGTSNPVFDMTHVSQQNTGTCTGVAAACVRASLFTDANFHHVCINWSGSQTTYFVDGNIRDQSTVASLTFAANVGRMTIGQLSQGVNQREVMVRSGSVFRSFECAYINNLGKAGLRPGSSDPVVQGLWAWWPLDPAGCTTNVSCPDISGNGRTLLFDTQPTVAITTPAPSAVLSGTSVSIQSTCTDTIGVSFVAYYLNGGPATGGLFLGSATGTPFTVVWNTTHFTDQPNYQLFAVCTNVGGLSQTSAGVTVSTANGLSPQAWYFSPSGNDANNCKTPATACTVNKQVSAAGSRFYLDGDTINLDASGGTLNPNLVTSHGIQIIGPSLTGQNAYYGTPTNPIIVQSYNGSGGCVPAAGLLGQCAMVQLGPASPTATVVSISGSSNIVVHNIQANCASVGQTPGTFKGGIVIVNQEALANYTITNNKIMDCANDIWTHAFTGTFVLTESNNFLTTSAPTVPTDLGMYNEGNFVTTVQSNVCSGLNGRNHSDGSEDNGAGSCVLTNNVTSINPARQQNVLDNVSHNAGNLTQHAAVAGCGSGYHFWSHQQAYVLQTNNEGYLFHTTQSPRGDLCDMGFQDADLSVNHQVFSGGYGHNDDGNCAIGLNGTDSSVSWDNNIFRFIICENEGTAQTGPGAPLFGGAFGQTGSNTYYYGNTNFDNLAAHNTFATGSSVCAGATASADFVMANNLCVAPTATLGWALNSTVTPSLQTFVTNLYYLPANTSRFASVGSTSYATLAAWKSGTSKDVGSLSSNPMLAGVPPFGNCYSGTGIPAGPAPCQAGYQVTTGSPAIGVGTNVNSTFPAQWLAATVDYYGATLGNGIGTGWNMGADGSHH